jgi:DNA-binding transcriptional ArsR family regulator
MPANASSQSRLDQTLLALSDPTRRRLVERLGRRPQRPTDLGRGLPMTRPAVSRHLRVLRNAGLVEAEPQGRELLYRLAENARGLEEARDYFERTSRGWDQALAAFKKFAESEDPD